jgi:hypothetical protein
VPLTVKFSEDFYRKLGHEAVDELVNWFNAVDTSYRGDLRELNELNFARFDAKLEQRVAEVKAELRQEVASLRTELREGMVGLRGEMGALRGECRAQLGEVRGEFRAQLGELRGEFRAQLGELRGEFRAQLGAEAKRLMKWMFVFWAGNVASTALLIFGLVHFLRP